MAKSGDETYVGRGDETKIRFTLMLAVSTKKRLLEAMKRARVQFSKEDDDGAISKIVELFYTEAARLAHKGAKSP